MSEPLVVVAESDQPSVVLTETTPSVVMTTVGSERVIVASEPAASSVVVTEPTDPVAVVVQEATSVVVTEDKQTEVIVAGVQGPPGPRGEIGPAGGSAFTAPAGETLSGHRVVQLIDGQAYYCDADNPDHAGTAIGLTTGAALIGDEATIQTLGNLIEPSWSWTPGPVYLGSQGQLTQTPAGMFLQQIGVALSTTSININPQLAITHGD